MLQPIDSQNRTTTCSIDLTEAAVGNLSQADGIMQLKNMFPHKSGSDLQKLCDEHRNIDDIVDILLNEASNHEQNNDEIILQN